MTEKLKRNIVGIATKTITNGSGEREPVPIVLCDDGTLWEQHRFYGWTRSSMRMHTAEGKVVRDFRTITSIDT